MSADNTKPKVTPLRAARDEIDDLRANLAAAQGEAGRLRAILQDIVRDTRCDLTRAAARAAIAGES